MFKNFIGKIKVKNENSNSLNWEEGKVERWKKYFCFVFNREDFENIENIKMNN